MTDQQSASGSSIGQKAVIKHKRGISFIWFLPVIAALIGAWLIYKGVAEAPLEVVINFESAEGISAEKTKVLYKGIEMGMVSAVALSPDQQSVNVTVEFDHEDKQLLLDTTQFWLVKPRLSLQGVSGLGTMLGGDYIAMNLGSGEGKSARKYKALPEPPVVSKDAPGLHISLISKDLATFEPGSPVYYKGIEVGDVEKWVLSEDTQQTEIKIYIYPEYSDLVHEYTHFFNDTGIKIEGGLTGFTLRTKSLTSIMLGGIAFTTPKNAPKGTKAQNGDQFELFEDFKEAEAGIPITIRFPTAEGLEEGQTKVVFEGVQAGYLKRLQFQPDLSNVIAEVIMDVRSEPYLLSDTEFWLSETKVSLTGVSGLENLLGANHIQVVVGGKGKPQREFVALEEPPVLKAREPGLHIKLVADELGSIDRETPVYYKKIDVGVVESYELNKKTGKIEAQVFIEKEFQHLVMTTSRFWNASGISVTGGLSGLEIRTESLESILSSGIAFYTPEDDPKARRAKTGDAFTLHEDYKSAHVTGLPITITFDSADGLGEGTKIKYHGINVGTVNSISFDPSMGKVILSAHLDRTAGKLAREGARFWVVKPEFGLAAVSNLGTLIGGDYIAIQPSAQGGKPANDFIGLKEPPIKEFALWGLPIVLVSDQLGSVRVGNNVFYRNIVVGEVTSYELANTGDHVRIYLNIQKRYTPLVRENSVFWNASGADVDFGLFSGLEIKTESFEAILAGGIAFATPDTDKMGEAAPKDTVFKLHPKVQDSWLQWKPRIELPE
jgi:paraquat-inducible protein B